MANNTEVALEFGLKMLAEYIFRFGPDFLSWAHDVCRLGNPAPYLVGFLIGSIFAVICPALYPSISSIWKKDKRNMLGTGKIFYSKHNLLDAGNFGSKVYQGQFERIDVAVKVIKLRSVKDAEQMKEKLSLSNGQTVNGPQQNITLNSKRLMREVSINQSITLKNDFIVHYHGQEIYQLNQTAYLLIALELCNANLQNVVDLWSDYERLSSRQIMEDLGNGLAFLHQEGLIHRDLKPANMLAKRYFNPDAWRFKISDFGTSKSANFVQDEGHFSISGPFGSYGSKAPEVIQQLNEGTVGTSAADIFSMGLVYYFTETLGKHLYASQESIQSNTLNVDIDPIIKEKPVWDLILKMTQPDPCERLSASEVMKHPVLWSSKKVNSFYGSVSEVLRKTNVPELENHSCFRGDWNEALSTHVKRSMENGRYNYRSVKDLIRAIRNADVHYVDSTRNVKREYGAKPEFFMKYWAKRFPKLLIHTYVVMENHQVAKGQLSQFY